MIYKLKLFFIFLLICLSWQTATAQDYRGILPMHSTCKDVERILGGEHCGKEKTEFTVDRQEIKIKYSTKKCGKHYGLNWDIPIGTVVFIQRNFLNPITLQEFEKELGLKIEEPEFSKSLIENDTVTDEYFYVRKDEGLLIETMESFVELVYYTPTKSDEEKLLCDESEVQDLKEQNNNCNSKDYN